MRRKRRSGLPSPPDPKNGSPGAAGAATGAGLADVQEGTPRSYPSRKPSTSPLARLIAADAAVCAYDGQTLAGVVTKHGDSYESYDARGRFLGRYTSQRAAVQAIPAGGAS